MILNKDEKEVTKISVKIYKRWVMANELDKKITKGNKKTKQSYCR